jgi:hypothetical protein
MAITQSAYFDLLDNTLNALQLVTYEETTILHPYVEGQAIQAIVACEDACIVDGVFDWRNAMPDDSSALRIAALTLLNTLTSECSGNAWNEREALLAVANCQRKGVAK